MHEQLKRNANWLRANIIYAAMIDCLLSYQQKVCLVKKFKKVLSRKI